MCGAPRCIGRCGHCGRCRGRILASGRRRHAAARSSSGQTNIGRSAFHARRTHWPAECSGSLRTDGCSTCAFETVVALHRRTRDFYQLTRRPTLLARIPNVRVRRLVMRGGPGPRAQSLRDAFPSLYQRHLGDSGPAVHGPRSSSQAVSVRRCPESLWQSPRTNALPDVLPLRPDLYPEYHPAGSSAGYHMALCAALRGPPVRSLYSDSNGFLSAGAPTWRRARGSAPMAENTRGAAVRARLPLARRP